MEYEIQYINKHGEPDGYEVVSSLCAAKVKLLEDLSRHEQAFQIGVKLGG